MFNIGRLAVARKRRQLTKKALAAAAGLSQLTLTRIETGITREPDAATVEALAKALDYPKTFFFRDTREAPRLGAVSFRSLSGLTARQRDAALAAAVLAEDVEAWVEARFDLAHPDVPDMRHETPAAAAAALRAHWGLGYQPIADMVRLLESRGVRVFALAEDNQNVDAYSYWHGAVPFVFLNTFKSAERSRFDAAHELGHLVLHRSRGPESRTAEREADQFSAAFLVPPEDLIANAPRLMSVQQLVRHKQRWGVSVSALARCAFTAGLVSDWHYRALCKQMSVLGYRTHEPQPRVRDTSLFWRKVLDALWRERVTQATIGEDLGLPLDEVTALVAGLLEAPAPMPVERMGRRVTLHAV